MWIKVLLFYSANISRLTWLKEMPAASSRGSHGSKLRNSGCKRTISDLKQYKREWCKTVNVFPSKTIYFSPGLVWNSKQDIKVLVTAILRHICYLLNIREGKFSFSLPDDLTVEDFFSMTYIYDCVLHLFFKGNSGYYVSWMKC